MLIERSAGLGAYKASPSCRFLLFFVTISHSDQGVIKPCIIAYEVAQTVALVARSMRKVRAPQGWLLGNAQCA